MKTQRAVKWRGLLPGVQPGELAACSRLDSKQSELGLLGLQLYAELEDLDLTVECKNSCPQDHQGLSNLLDWRLICSQVYFVFKNFTLVG